MKEGWKMVKLGKVLQRQFDSVQIDDFEAYKRLTIKTKGQGISLRDEVLGAEIGTKNQFKVRANQFLLSKIDAMNGAFGIIPKECDGGIITGNFWTFDFDEDVLNREYLDFLCIGGVFTDFSLKASEGTTNRKYLREDKFNNLDFPLPPLTEQQRIAGRLAALKGKIDAVRALRGEQVREVERVKNTYLGQVFDDLESQYKSVKLSDIASVNMGQSPDGSSYNQNGEGVPLLNGPTEFGAIHPKEIQWTTSPTKFCQKGDLLICVRGATTGKMNWADKSYCIGRGLAAIRAKADVFDNDFVQQFLAARINQLLALTAGSTFPNLPGEKLKTFQIPLLPLTEQRRIVAEIQAFQTKMEQLKAAQAGQLAGLEGLFPAVLEKAFRGEW
ncbi:MAG: hypothetical protein EPGJADBJ_03505 [Saprospiraceae bacterium]|nr:hypothetical protein [Saprospiraceae bacterium]